MRRLAVCLTFALAACRSAGPYGYAPDYVATDDESRAIAGARDFDPVMYDRQRDEWRKGPVMLFGVVDTREPGPGGQAMLKLTVRRLEPRNQCKNPGDDDSCRVTVSDAEFGVVYALVALKSDDDTGPRAVGQQSLLRLVGTFGEEVNSAPVLHASYYRHWPSGQWALRGAR